MQKIIGIFFATFFYTFHLIVFILGMNGTDGYDVPALKMSELLGFICNKTISSGKEETITEYKYCGSAAVQGTNGGDGGCGGYGGESGEVQLFGLSNQSNIVLVKQNGEIE